MGLSINPLDILKIFQDRRAKDRESVANYLDSIAEDAYNLALIWEQAVKTIVNGSDVIGDKAEEQMRHYENQRLRYEMVGSNDPFYWRLVHFYEEISVALEGHLSRERRDNIISLIGTILSRRSVTKEMYESTVSSMTQPLFLDDSTGLKDFADLRSSAKALHKEAAALKVLAQSFRVSGK